MRIDKLLKYIDKYSSYIPIASTITNSVDIFEKAVVIPNINPEKINKNYYWIHIQKKSYLRSTLLLVPVLGNVSIGIYDLSQQKWKDKQYVIQALETNTDRLKHASKKLKNDRDFMLSAISKKAKAIKYASDELRNDKDFMLKILNYFVIEYQSDEKHLELFYFYTLAHASIELRNDEEFMLESIRLFEGAIEFIGNDLTKNKHFMLTLIKKYSCAIHYLDRSLMNDRSFMRKAIKINPNIMKYASAKLKKDPVLLAAFKTSKSQNKSLGSCYNTD